MTRIISDVGRTHLKWALTDGVGPLLFSRILLQFGDAESALGASAASLAKIRRIGGKSAERIVRERDQVDINEQIQAATEHDVRILCREDHEYPPGLEQIPDAPIVLFVKGDLRQTDAVAIAVVGTRRCTIYGSEQARRFGELLAGAGFTVVSGLARGIDAFAHHGAVDAGGRSIAVMGKGFPEIYPPENKALAEKVLDSGAWISELPMRSQVQRKNFPSRNRIIAGMSLGTLVIEAPKQSGALITARLANEYNREVFALPGRAQDVMSYGTNDLIRQSYAKLTMCLEDIIEEMGDVGEQMRFAGPPAASDSDSGAPPDAASRIATRAPALSETEQRVFDVVPFEPMFQDVVLEASQLPPGEVLAAFTALEIKGLIKRLPGQLVVRVGKV